MKQTRVATEILKSLGVPWVLVISQDNFYNSLSPEQSAAAFRNEHGTSRDRNFGEGLGAELTLPSRCNRL